MRTLRSRSDFCVRVASVFSARQCLMPASKAVATCVVIGLVALLSLPSLAFAQEDTLIFLGSNSDMYHIWAVSAYNKNAFVTDDDWGLRVINYSDPHNPYTVTRYTEPARDIEIKDSLAYYVGGGVLYSGALYIRDISDPLTSEIIDSCSIGYHGFRIHLFDDLALVMYRSNWEYCYLDIIDISDPTDPQALSTYTTVPPYSTTHWGDVYKKDNYVYWVDREYYPDAGKIVVFDISDPMDPVPTVVDTCLPSPPYGIWIKDDYAYVADSWGGLMIMDISDRYNIDSVGCFKIPERAVYNVYIKGNLAYLSAHVQLPPHVSGGEIYVLDITDRAAPFLVAHYDSLQSPRDVFVDEPYVLVADYTSLVVLEASFLHYAAGDANGDGQVNGGDVVFIINYLYRQGTPPQLVEAADANGDCVVNASDVVYLLNYLFRNAPPPQSGCAFY